MHTFNGRSVNLRLGCPKCLKDCNRRLLSRLADYGFSDNLANLIQPVPVRALMWRRRPRTRTIMSRRVLVLAMMVVIVTMRSVLVMTWRGRGCPRHTLLRPVLLPRHILLAVHPNVHL